jgi:hypothetical protein
MKLQLDTNAIYRRKDDLGPYDVAARFEHKCASDTAAWLALQLAQQQLPAYLIESAAGLP